MLSTINYSKYLQINLLGTPHAILQNGETVLFQVDNTLLLMAILGSQPGKILRRTELASLFYPDNDPQHANQNIRQVIHRLRKLLKDDLLETPALLVDASSIRINPDGPIVFDIQTLNVKFNEVQNFITRHSHRRFNICHTCRQHQAELVELYTGDFLDGYETHINTPVDNLVPNLRQEFKTRLLSSLHWLADYHFERQQYDSCEKYLSRIARIEPLDELTLRRRMKILVNNAQRNQALIIFQEFQRMLQINLNIIPEEETLLLGQAIRTGKNNFLPDTNNLLPFVNQNLDGDLLPDASLRFFDRRDESLQITELLDSREHRVIVIKGVIGSGKTRLALHIAGMEKGAWADGIYLLHMNKFSVHYNNLVMALIQLLNVPAANSSDDRKKLVNFLREKECLLLVDNLDGNPGHIEVIQSLVNLCPRIKFIITSRTHLGIHAEKIIHFNGLEYPSLQDFQQDTINPNQIDVEAFINKYSALQLFNDTAVRARADYVLDVYNLSFVIQTCEMLLGLPQLIELAASYARLFTCEEIRDAVFGGLNNFEGITNFITDRHGNFKKQFEEVWESLDQHQRELVKIVYQYPDGVVTDELLAAGLTNIETLVTLQDKSTLIRMPGSRVKLHPLIRFFCNQ